MQICVSVARVPPILCRDSANECSGNLLTDCRVPPILCKDSANERSGSLLTDCRVPPILCKDTKKTIPACPVCKESAVLWMIFMVFIPPVRGICCNFALKLSYHDSRRTTERRRRCRTGSKRRAVHASGSCRGRTGLERGRGADRCGGGLPRQDYLACPQSDGDAQ
jgi:hypothetical protein